MQINTRVSTHTGIISLMRLRANMYMIGAASPTMSMHRSRAKDGTGDYTKLNGNIVEGKHSNASSAALPPCQTFFLTNAAKFVTQGHPHFVCGCQPHR